MAIDQSRKNRCRPAINPLNIWMKSTQVVEVTDVGDLSTVDQNGAISPAPQRAELGGIDEKTAEAEPAIIALHNPRRL